MRIIVVVAMLVCYHCVSVRLNETEVFSSRVMSMTMRMHPNQDIMTTLTQSLKYRLYSALSIVSAVGSVSSCWIRFANKSTLSYLQGPFEIVSLSGTLDQYLQPHIHIALSDGAGSTLGGHLPSLEERGSSYSMNCPIFTTLELSLLLHQDVIFERRIDPDTTFHQLYIKKKLTFS